MFGIGGNHAKFKKFGNNNGNSLQGNDYNNYNYSKGAYGGGGFHNYEPDNE